MVVVYITPPPSCGMHSTCMPTIVEGDGGEEEEEKKGECSRIACRVRGKGESFLLAVSLCSVGLSFVGAVRAAALESFAGLAAAPAPPFLFSSTAVVW